MRRVTTAAAVLFVALAGCSSSGSSASGTSAPSMSENQARQTLEDQGYTGLADLHRVANGWEGTAMRNGEQVTVDIDQDGIIHTR